MRFLVDQCLSVDVADRLAAAGHDAVHVSAYAMSGAADERVLSRARDERRVLLSADTDFGGLLATGGGTLPSVVLYRRHAGRRPEQQADVLLRGLPALEGELAAGAIAVLGDAGNRIHRLPVDQGRDVRAGARDRAEGAARLAAPARSRFGAELAGRAERAEREVGLSR